LDEPNCVGVQVTGLAQYTVVQICAGANHSLAVDEWGSLFRDKVPARILRLVILFFITAAVSCCRKIPNSGPYTLIKTDGAIGSVTVPIRILDFIGPVFTTHRSLDPNFLSFYSPMLDPDPHQKKESRFWIGIKTDVKFLI
jgi:hypothetical protein